MDFITLVRIAIWLTFFLLIIEGIAAIIVIHKFYAYYIRRHAELEARIARIELRLGIAGKHEP